MSDDASNLASALVGGGAVAVAHVFTLLRGHFAIDRKVALLARRIELICERLGIDIESGPHVVEVEKDKKP